MSNKMIKLYKYMISVIGLVIIAVLTLVLNITTHNFLLNTDIKEIIISVIAGVSLVSIKHKHTEDPEHEVNKE